MKWKKTRRNICGQLTPGLTCLSALCTPAQPTSTPVLGPAPPSATPSRKPAVPRLARHPHPSPRASPTCCAQETSWGWGGRHGVGDPSPISSAAGSSALPQARAPGTGLESGDSGGLWGEEDQEVGEGTPRKGAPRAGKEPEAGGCKEPEPKAEWRQPRGQWPLR